MTTIVNGEKISDERLHSHAIMAGGILDVFADQVPQMAAELLKWRELGREIWDSEEFRGHWLLPEILKLKWEYNEKPPDHPSGGDG